MDYDLCVFIGRFQILHVRHLAIMLQALKHADKLAVMVGSAESVRSHRNPFTFEERAKVILESIAAEGQDPSRIICFPLEDTVYNDDLWVSNVRKAVTLTGAKTVALIGYAKDYTSYYLQKFPEWNSINVPGHITYSSTQMRELYFSNICEMWLNDCDGHREGDTERDRIVPTPMRAFLVAFKDTPEYKMIRAEYEYIIAYRAPYASLPFPPIFNTADALVTESGHLLLVRRGRHPGKGTWAFPGGFVKFHQTIRQAMVDELCEETLIDTLGGVDKIAIEASIVAQRHFDDPYRDPRGRIITHAFHVNLNNKRATVKGDDDAAEAKWWKLEDVRRNMMFADHYDIAKAMGIL